MLVTVYFEFVKEKLFRVITYKKSHYSLVGLGSWRGKLVNVPERMSYHLLTFTGVVYSHLEV